MIEEILSSSKGSPIKDPETPAAPAVSSVHGSEQASTETSPLSKQTPSSRPVLKKKATSKQGPTPTPVEEPSSKKSQDFGGPLTQIGEISQKRSCEGQNSQGWLFQRTWT